MNRERARQVEEIFLAVLEGGPGRRAELLAERCAEDAGLRAEVEELLALHGEETGLLDRESPVSISGVLRLGAAEMEPEEKLAPGTRVGAYTIRSFLGSGGMGVVYVAEQERPRRTVALKVIRHGLATPMMLRRFELEAEVLGRLHHPGIAQIYEAGAAEIGPRSGRQPYLAIEMIHGPPLIQYCDEHNLPARDRLALMVRICDAVQHAHNKGVIHRDLKPGNILVEQAEEAASADGTADRAASQPSSSHGTSLTGLISAQPKVLDFGVARATNSDLAVTTIHTNIGQLIGTLAYMSPEQVAGDTRDVDTRSDVYSLGVILYQLLTGKLPHDVAKRPIPEAARIIRDEPPARLSTINRSLRGDLETIVTKAMEKQKDRRYQSAAALGADLTRYLAGEPIEAKRDSVFYVLEKLVRRHRAASAFATGLVILFIIFAIYAAVQASVRGTLNARMVEQLSAANIERGRLLGVSGNLDAAEDYLWNEIFAHPDSPAARWALRDLYRLYPVGWTAERTVGIPSVVAVSQDGRTAINFGSDKTLEVWDTTTWTLSRRWTIHKTWLQDLAISGDGSVALTGAQDDPDVVAWNTRTGGKLAALPGHSGRYRHVALSDDGKRAFTTDTQGRSRLWDLSTIESTHTLTGNTYIHSARFSHDGTRLVTAYRTGDLLIWNTETGKVEKDLAFHEDPIRTVRFSPDGRTLWAGTINGVLKLIDLETGAVIRQTSVDKSVLGNIDVTRDGSLVAAGSQNSLVVYDAATLTPVYRLAENSNGTFPVAFHPSGDWLLAIMNGAVLRRWDLAGRQGARVLAENLGWVIALDVSPDGKLVAFNDRSKTATDVLDIESGRPVRSFAGLSGVVQAVAFSPDGKSLAVGMDDGRYNVLSLETGATLFQGSTDPSMVMAVDFTSDGQRLAVAHSKGHVSLVRLKDGTEEISLDDVAPIIQVIAISRDDTRLAVGANQPGITLIDLTNGGKILRTIDKPSVWGLEFSPDDDSLFCAGFEISARVRRVEDLFSTQTLRGHTDVILDCAYGAAGDTMATASVDSTIRLWDRRTGNQLVTLSGHVGQVSCVRFALNDRVIVTGGQDGKVLAFDLGRYDASIAGNVYRRALIEREEFGARFDTRPMERWADGVLGTGRGTP